MDSQKASYYFILRDTPNNESIIVEYGFVDSNKDDVSQIKNNYKDLAEAVVKAVCDYKGIKYTPVSSSPSKYYIVKKGDTLWDIANEYNTTVETLKKINNLTNSNLIVNQQLFIPKNDNSGVKNNVYVVKKGDTLYDIAFKYGVSVKEIKEANNLNSDTLQIGQLLDIPQKSSGEINYIVQKGDNLYTIANKYDVSVGDIKKLNNLQTDTIQIGQVLKIPGSTNYNTYIVKKGDTLWDIANKYGTTVKKLMTINNLDTSVLTIGQSIIIPTN